MKQIIIIIALSALLISSCAVFSPTPTATPVPPTPMPTATPDPCSPENIINEAENLQAIVNSFQDGMNIANNTDVSLLIHPILRLQEIQMDIRQTKVPVCLQALKDDSTKYTVSVINYLLIFMNTQDPTSEELTNAIQNSQLLWQQVTDDFNTILTTAGIPPQQLPQLNQTLPGEENTGPVLINEGPGSVNVRADPNLDAEIVATLGMGQQADVLGRTEAGDWIQINLNSVLGWVFAETVTVSVPIDTLPVVGSNP